MVSYCLINSAKSSNIAAGKEWNKRKVALKIAYSVDRDWGTLNDHMETRISSKCENTPRKRDVRIMLHFKGNLRSKSKLSYAKDTGTAQFSILKFQLYSMIH